MDAIKEKYPNSADIQPSQILSYKQVGDGALSLHVFTPADHSATDSRPAVLFFFGGGWVSGSPVQFYGQARYLASRGMVAICVEYRTANSHQTSPVECVQDGKSAMRYVRSHAAELGIDPDSIAAGGGSAGAHVASATATVNGFDEPSEDTSISCRPNALILFNPVYDNGPTGFGYERVKDFWESFSPMHNLHADMGPAIVLLGTEDHLLSPEHAEEFQQKMQALGVRSELRLYEGHGHGFFNRVLFHEPLIETDKFLESIGYLDGEPTLTV